jgi:hypothetical protein
VHLKKTEKIPFSKENPGARAALLSGPPGIGKSTVAALAAREGGYDVSKPMFPYYGACGAMWDGTGRCVMMPFDVPTLWQRRSCATVALYPSLLSLFLFMCTLILLPCDVQY